MTNLFLRCLILLLAGCVTSNTSISNPELEAITTSCQEKLEAIYASGSFPGATASVVLKDGKVVQLAVGNTEQGGRALTPKDRMLVGSAGKTWVSGIVQHLVAKKVLSYDNKAIEWFQNDEWFLRIPNAKDVTVRQLLKHQSGLERYEFKPEFWQELMLDPDRVWRPKELLEFVFDDQPMFQAGTAWAYADTNYILLGMIIERATGQSFYSLADQWINQPYALYNTIPSNRRRLKGVVQGTVIGGQQLGVGPLALSNGAFTYNVQFEWCGGGFASTATDLAQWARVFFSHRFLQGAHLEELLNAVPAPALGPNRSYGLGVILAETRLGQFYGHDGFMPGYLTAMGYFPEFGISAAIQVNTDDGRAIGMPLQEALVELVECAM
ncbi:MAG: serine hydrolase domain-containing protein [Planctomycetota bacterium]|jgi:D-alanyl-D-alanine carboxypeptidase|nr:serine hydrolase domain-containing protein [Planctomycetota bacterium]